MAFLMSKGSPFYVIFIVLDTLFVDSFPFVERPTEKRGLLIPLVAIPTMLQSGPLEDTLPAPPNLP